MQALRHLVDIVGQILHQAEKFFDFGEIQFKNESVENQSAEQQ